MLAPRAGLVVDPGSKVTYKRRGDRKGGRRRLCGGRRDRQGQADIDRRTGYLGFIPRNVIADVGATTVFGNKYIAFSSPKDPSTQRITSRDIIDASPVTTEFNTLFETVMEISEQVDPVKLNATLNAAAQAFTGLGERFGDSLADANRIMDDLNPRMPQIRADTQAVADLAEVYADASPDLWDGLDNAVATARTINEQRGGIDAALMAAIGFSNTATESFERGGPYLVRAAEDLLPTTKLLDDYRAMIFCTTRNYAEVGPRLEKTLGGDNGYALRSYGNVLLPGNPFIYPDNLPRVNAKGGPRGTPRLLAEGHEGSLAVPVSGDGHRA